MKRRYSYATLLSVAIVITLLTACVLAARGQEGGPRPQVAGQSSGVGGRESGVDSKAASDLSAQLQKAKERLAPTYLLAYKFSPGEEFRTSVVHLATVETKIKGVTQTTKSRTVSTRLWRIKDVADNGNIVFDNVVERVEMWNSVEGRQELKYDSASGEKPPPEFEYVAGTVGKVLATVTIDPQGRILARQNHQPHFNPGIGELTIPFPNVPVKAGASWSIPEELKITAEDGTVKRIPTRQQYRLEKVEAGVAMISIQTQVLAPVSDPKIQAQLVQRLQRGTIKFDIDAGRLLSKQMDTDEEVFGFNGADSHMQYLSRLTEEPLASEPADRRAKIDGPTTSPSTNR